MKPKLTDIQLSWAHHFQSCSGRLIRGGESRGLFTAGLYLPGLNILYFCLISYGQISIIWPSLNATGVSKYKLVGN